MPRKDTREIRALLEEALTAEAQNPELYAHLLVSLGVTAGQKPTHAQLIVAQLIQKGIEGDMKAIQEILDRLLGKSVQHNQHVTATLSYQDFLFSLVDEREKKELGIIEVTPTPEIPEAEKVRALPPVAAPTPSAPAPRMKKKPKSVDPMEELL